MFFNSVSAAPIIIEVFGKPCSCYPASGYNMIIANMNGIFNYTEEYVKTGKVVEYDGRFVLTDFDESLYPDERTIKITSEKKLKEYLIKVNNWMSEQLRRGLPEASRNMADSILEVLD